MTVYCSRSTACFNELLHTEQAFSPVSGPSWSISVFTYSHSPVQACSLSVFHNCSLTSVGRVLKRSSSTTRPVLFSCRHSPSSTGRHSSRFPLSSSCVSPVSSPNRDGRDCRQLFPKFKVRSFLHWNSSLGKPSIFIFKVWGRWLMGEKQRGITICRLILFSIAYNWLQTIWDGKLQCMCVINKNQSDYSSTHPVGCHCQVLKIL